MHNYESGMFSGTECGGIVLCPRPRTFSVTPAMFAEQYSEHACIQWSFFRLFNCDCIDYWMDKFVSGMCSVMEYGTIVLGPRPRTFGVTPAIFAKQYREHA